MTTILEFAGKKQSGKSSAAQFVAAYVVSQVARANPGLPLPKSFTQDEDGEIIVKAYKKEESGEYSTENGVLELSRKDVEFAEFASQYIWPYVKIYSYADPLKRFCMEVFGLTFEQCFGTNQEKESPSIVRRKDMEAVINTEIPGDGEYLTAREVLKYFGTNVCRSMYKNCFIEATLNKIFEEEPELAIIDDCRFSNEVYLPKRVGALVYKLDGRGIADSHESENALDEVPAADFDAIIQTHNLSIKEKNQLILDSLYKDGVFSEHIPLQGV